jgi:hypothetical protein
MPVTQDQVGQSVKEILETLGSPTNEAQAQALQAFTDGEVEKVKMLSLGSPTDEYLKCLGYLVSAPKLTPGTLTLLTESARAAIAWKSDKELKALSNKLVSLLQ